MVTINIEGSYDISGTNKGEVTCLSTDIKPRDTTDPRIRNGFRLYEMDTRKTYLYDESIHEWRYWKTEGDGGGGGGGSTEFATNGEAQAVLDSVFKNRGKG